MCEFTLPSIQESQLIRVGIAQGAIVSGPDRIGTTGLGSCVGVVLYHARKNIAGLVHIMLPQSPANFSGNVCKYADLALDWLLDEFSKQGLRPSSLKAKAAGGAQMFSGSANSDILRVGPRNAEAVENYLRDAGVELVSTDFGGNTGRTIEFDLQTELLQIRTAIKGTYTI